MLIRVDPSSPTALFAQVAASIRSDIEGGALQAGDRLAAAREVADALGVNVHTVLRAYGTLRDEGLIELRRGRGAVVTGRADRADALRADVRVLVAKARAAGVAPQALVSLVQEVAHARS